MKKSNSTVFIKKLIFFFCGLWIIQTGVAIFIRTNIGSDPFTVLTQGISRTLGITTGTANITITFVFLITILIVDRKTINIGTVLALVSAGPFIDLMLAVLQPIEFSEFNIMVKMLLLALSCVIVAIGFAMLKATELGVAPNDLIPLIIHEKTNLTYQWIRISMDSIFVVAGFMLGGVIGVGTIIGAFLTGPAIQFFMPKLEKVIKPIIYKDSYKEEYEEEIAQDCLNSINY